MISDQPFLFVIFALTANNEVMCITETNELVLPRYEFQRINQKEAITNALKRQIGEDTGYDTREIILTDFKIHHTAEGRRRNKPFRVCLAHGCIPRETEESARPISPFPFVQWGLEKNYSEKFESFQAWSARKKREPETEKNKVTLIPFDAWNGMIERKEVTDLLSVAATEMAIQWMAFPKPPSFSRK